MVAEVDLAEVVEVDLVVAVVAVAEAEVDLAAAVDDDDRVALAWSIDFMQHHLIRSVGARVRKQGITMNSKCKINRKAVLINTNSLILFVSRSPGAFLLIAILVMAINGLSVGAGSERAFPQGMNPEQVAAAIKANAQALNAFSYQQRMQLQLKGETKKVTLTQMSHDMNGNLQKTQLSEDPSPDAAPQSSGGRRGGRLKQRVVAKKTGEFKQMMGEISDLVKSYSELPPQQLQAGLKQATFSQGQGDMDGSVQIQMQNVIQQGDSLTIWIDRTAMLFRRIAIATTYEQNPVTATANYAMLPTGQVHMAQAILNYPKKQVVVELDNMNYQRNQ